MTHSISDARQTWFDCGLTVAGVVLVAIAHLVWGQRGLVVDLVAAAFIVPLVLVDLRERRLPDGLTLGGAASLLLLLAIEGAVTGDLGPLAGAVLGALAMSGVLLVLHLASPAGMGFGDVKLGLLLGVILGSRSVGLVPGALLVAGALGAIGGLVLMCKHRRRDVTLPFGPYLVLGTVARSWPRWPDRRPTNAPGPGTGGRYHPRVLRFLTAGESHGQALVVIVEGLPAGLALTVEEVQGELARRRLGYGRGPRMQFEADDVTLLGGIRHGRTLGSPVAIEIKNSEWFRSDRWHEEMSPAPGRTEHPLTQPRPGHADLAGMQKYGFRDARDVLERASARETAARVAAGCLAKAMLAPLGVSVLSHVVQMGPARSKSATRPGPGDLEAVDASPVRCFDAAAQEAMIAEIEGAAREGDSLGGVVEILAYGVPVGLGSHVHWDRKLDGLLAQAIMSIHAVKGVEVGDGFEVAGRRGSQAHDPIVWDAASGPATAGNRRWPGGRRAA